MIPLPKGPLRRYIDDVMAESLIGPPPRSITRDFALALREKGLSLQKIADALNAEGHPTPTRRGKWYPATVAELLK